MGDHRSGIGEKVFGREGIVGKLRRRSSSKTVSPCSAELWKTMKSEAKLEFDRKWAAGASWTAQRQPPTCLDDFEIRTTLGTGSFARVILVRHKTDRKFYALKILNKEVVVKKKQIEHTLCEKQILQCIAFPFIVNMTYSFKDNANLYMALDYVNGGEMFTYLRRIGRFCEVQCRFYASQLVLVLEYLHSNNIVFRDLKPENLLLCADGYIKLADFGFSKRVQGRTYTLCGTPDYLAPEIVLARGYGISVDWWALGVLLFEMNAGYPPFYSNQPIRTYEMIVDGKVTYPTNMTSEIRDLLRNLLQVDVTRRYGCMKNGASEVKEHRWFTGIDWLAIYLKTVEAPYRPDCSAGEGDTGNFDKFDEQPIATSPEELYRKEFAEF